MGYSVSNTRGTRALAELSLEGYNADKYEDGRFSCKIVHPRMTNAVTGDSWEEIVGNEYNYLNDNNFDYFCLEYDWGIQKGKWTFQIIEEDIVKLEKSF